MDINEKFVLETAWKTGHFFNPGYPDVLNVDESSFGKLVARDKVARLAIASLQQSDINFDLVSAETHGRKPLFDGDIGPATMKLVQGWTTKGHPLQRCPLPDFAPPPNASFHYDDPELQAAVESMQKAAANPGIEGPYWRGCDPQRPDVHSLVIGIDARNAPPNWRTHQEKILDARRACAAEIGVAVRFVVNPPSMDGLQQWQVFRGIAGSTIGLNYFPSSNSCGRIPSGSLDTGYDPSDWRLHANLGTHESEGHGFGFNHTRGGIMNPSIVLVWPLSWKNDPGWSQVTRYYPAKPLDMPTPVPTPTPVPGPVGKTLWEADVPAGRIKLVQVSGGTPTPPQFPV